MNSDVISGKWESVVVGGGGSVGKAVFTFIIVLYSLVTRETLFS